MQNKMLQDYKYLQGGAMFGTFLKIIHKSFPVKE